MSEQRPVMAVGIACKSPRAELQWLEAAFGFETTLLIEGEDGSLAHSEMRVGRGGQIMVGREWDDLHRSPASIGGLNTQSVHVNLDDDADIDAHFRRAVAAGATVLREPADQVYGDRLYAVLDPEGHQWTFGRRLDMTSGSGEA